MTSTTNLSYQEVKEILAIFFNIPEDQLKCWNNQWSFNCSVEYIQAKIDENRKKLKTE